MDGGKQELIWARVEDLTVEAPYPPREQEPPLDFLVSSVRLHGIVSPLLARRRESGALQVVCGFRRLLAARDAELERVPVLVSPLSDAAAIRCFLAENMCRQDLPEALRVACLDLLGHLRDEEDGDSRVPAVGAVRPELQAALPAPDHGSEEAPPRRLPLAGTASGPLFHAGPIDQELIDLLEETHRFLERVRDTKRVDMEAACAVVDSLLAWLPGRSLPEPADLYGAMPADWLAPHSLLSAAIGGAMAPREFTALGPRGYALAGLLHDVGMVFFIPGKVSEEGGLSQRDRMELHGHTRIGHALIASCGKEHAEVALAARDHHERLDGSGYPQGLRGDLLGRLSRVMAVVDTFAALVGVRPHRRGLPRTSALAELREGAESGLFDAGVVDLLAEIVEVPDLADRESWRADERAVAEPELQPLVRSASLALEFY